MPYKIVISLLLCFAPALNGIIVHHDTIQVIKNYIPADMQKEDVLIVLDLDDTIAMSILDPVFKPWFNKVLVPHKDLPKLNFKHRFNYIAQLKPMESTTIELLKDLQKQGIPIIILTARMANLAQRTHEQVSRIGLDLSQSLSLANHTIPACPELPVPFHQGMLLCSEQNKGAVLSSFLKHNSLSPKKVIFVDDRTDHVASVNRAMQTMDIDCTTIHYTRKKEYGIMSKIKYSFKTLFGYPV